MEPNDLSVVTEETSCGYQFIKVVGEAGKMGYKHGNEISPNFLYSESPETKQTNLLPK